MLEGRWPLRPCPFVWFVWFVVNSCSARISRDVRI